MNKNQLSIEVVESELKEKSEEGQTATFGMGCFWGPEARFGSLAGVLATRVGYAGGTTENPTYRQMGDHTETIQIVFDPKIISYEEVLRHFWGNHYPNRDEYKGRQYISLLHYHNESQAKTIEAIKKEMEAKLDEAIETEIAAYSQFTEAELRHQKYYLKRYPKVLERLTALFPNEHLLTLSTFAARLNGFVKGFGTREALRKEIEEWPIAAEYRNVLIEALLKIKW